MNRKKPQLRGFFYDLFYTLCGKFVNACFHISYILFHFVQMKKNLP